MITVHQNLRLDDRHQPRFLAERSEHGERPRIRFDASLSWNTLVDRNHRAPLCEARSELPILLKSLAKAVESLGDLLTGKIGKDDGAFVHFDATNDALLCQHFGHENAALRLLTQRLVKQDHAADEFVQPVSRELTGESNIDVQAALLESIPESERWDPVPGSTGRHTPDSFGEDEDSEGRSESAQLVEEGVREAEHDQMLQAARAAEERNRGEP